MESLGASGRAGRQHLRTRPLLEHVALLCLLTRSGHGDSSAATPRRLSEFVIATAANASSEERYAAGVLQVARRATLIRALKLEFYAVCLYKYLHADVVLGGRGYPPAHSGDGDARRQCQRHRRRVRSRDEVIGPSRAHAVLQIGLSN
jgi:hypothetical protein